ncbi:MAG: MBOAT family protein, partial [Actinobacteria bacterium]|nr:MBOAT family protein [Actinomycetota bacterium]
GASWTFVVWGVLHGAFLVVHHARAARAPDRPPGLARRLLQVLVTFHLVVLAWVFFRAEDLAQALRYLEGIASLRGGAVAWSLAAQVAISAAVALSVDVLQRRTGREDFASGWAVPVRGALAGAAAFAIVVFSGGPGAPFIYFQF